MSRLAPPGQRAAVDEHGLVEILPDDAEVQYWVCFRVNEPWTWQVLPGQQTTACSRCGAAVVYLVSAKSPTDPSVRKVCPRCFDRLLDEDAAHA